MARYRVVFYRDHKGREPMRDWLEELRRYRLHLAQTASRLLKQDHPDERLLDLVVQAHQEEVN
ncbi:hypothetical protein TthAA37_23870 (plasmid) [Thermus thermophilus]|nr:hypothetical protein TthAA37_23870 [Thermus thermophilus]